MATLLPREIKKLKKGIIPDSIAKKPFIIVRHQVKFIIGNETNWEYLIIKDNNRRNDTVIDRKTAFEIIDNNNMQLSHEKSYGQLYELPGAPFHKMYANGAAVKQDKKEEKNTGKKRGRKPKAFVMQQSFT